MILSRLTETLRLHRRASLDDLATALQAAPEAVEAMLATLERKGRIRRLPAGSSCGKSCCACDPKRLQIYEWVDHDDLRWNQAVALGQDDNGHVPDSKVDDTNLFYLGLNHRF